MLSEDGWLRTGDIGVVDDDGFVFLVDRAKDLIIVSGFNVYPGEVEDVLRDHPAIADVAVVGVPHPHRGEAVKAFVVLKPGQSATEAEIRRMACTNPTAVLGIELVRDPESKEPFPRADRVTERVVTAAREGGLLLYSSTGHVDGNGDLLMMGPPFCLKDDEATTLVERTAAAIRSVV